MFSMKIMKTDMVDKVLLHGGRFIEVLDEAVKTNKAVDLQTYFYRCTMGIYTSSLFSLLFLVIFSSVALFLFSLFLLFYSSNFCHIHIYVYIDSTDAMNDIAFGVDLCTLKKEQVPFEDAFDRVQEHTIHRLWNPFWSFKKILQTKDEQDFAVDIKILDDFAYCKFIYTYVLIA